MERQRVWRIGVEGRIIFRGCRWTYREMFDEHSTKSSEALLRRLVEHAPFPIFEIHADNGTEFTKRLLAQYEADLTLFERLMAEYGIRYY